MNRAFDHFATWMATTIGKPATFVFTLLIVVPAFVTSLVSVTWREPINLWAGAIGSYVTAIMLVVLQNSQNRQAAAANAKDDEVIRALDAARNDLIRVEERTTDEIEALRG